MSLKNPTPWTKTTPNPTGFEPLGSANPTLFTNNDGSSPTTWAPGDTKNPTTYVPKGKNPTSFAPTWGITTLTYDTLGATYDDPTVTYDQAQQNQNTPAELATTWSASGV